MPCFGPALYKATVVARSTIEIPLSKALRSPRGAVPADGWGMYPAT
jgi:hypothetical protein